MGEKERGKSTSEKKLIWRDHTGLTLLGAHCIAVEVVVVTVKVVVVG